MSSVNTLSLLALALVQLCVLSALEDTSTEKNDVLTEKTDAFEILAAVTYAMAIKDTNTNPSFKCLTAKRILFDPSGPSATYEWSLNAGDGQPRKQATFYFTPSDAPDTATVVVNSDTSSRQTVRYPYTDYTTCGIMEVNYEGHHCTLWVKNATAPIPEECHQQHTKICGEGVSLYDKDTCSKVTE
ncbi:uncharacterized protein LOC119462829 [Dermacentor silvarum]|uniref:uncharacterized protein LOC119462829 n=1 Tax=Dermacentor silvarum TaxID=543639 RepID=UPI001899FC2B|nr:uncharacterized protein LOC119462829 [Dermacentor silvarum]